MCAYVYANLSNTFQEEVLYCENMKQLVRNKPPRVCLFSAPHRRGECLVGRGDSDNWLWR